MIDFRFLSSLYFYSFAKTRTIFEYKIFRIMGKTNKTYNNSVIKKNESSHSKISSVFRI